MFCITRMTLSLVITNACEMVLTTSMNSNKMRATTIHAATEKGTTTYPTLQVLNVPMVIS
jgi:hypothetical protein